MREDVDGSGGPHGASVDLPLDERAAARARQLVAEMLEAWHLADADLVYEAQLLTSEMVTNALRHGADGLSLQLEHRGESVTVAVRDGSAVLPTPREADDDAEGGRGLAIVAALAQDWGVENLPEGGKRVWARLRVGDA